MGTFILDIMPKQISGDAASIAEIFPDLADGTTIGKKEFSFGEKDEYVDDEYKNATGTDPNALFIQTQQSLDKAQKDLIDLTSKRESALGDLNLFQGNYKRYYDGIKKGDYNTSIDFIINQEKYGQPDSPIYGKDTPYWGLSVGDLRPKISHAINPIEWYGSGGNTIFGMGVAGNDPWRAAQIDLIKHWADNKYAPKEQKLSDIISARGTGLDAKISAKNTEIENLIKLRDKQVAQEGVASNQRIKEKLTSPEYIKAKTEADRIQMDYIYKKQRNQLIVVGLVGAGLLGLGVLYLLKK